MHRIGIGIGIEIGNRKWSFNLTVATRGWRRNWPLARSGPVCGTIDVPVQLYKTSLSPALFVFNPPKYFFPIAIRRKIIIIPKITDNHHVNHTHGSKRIRVSCVHRTVLRFSAKYLIYSYVVLAASVSILVAEWHGINVALHRRDAKVPCKSSTAPSFGAYIRSS